MIYERRSKQTVCVMKTDKGRSCHGSLKKYHPFAKDFGETNPARQQEIAQRFGNRADLSLYRCNYCGTLYTDPPAAAVRR